MVGTKKTTSFVSRFNSIPLVVVCSLVTWSGLNVIGGRPNGSDLLFSYHNHRYPIPLYPWRRQRVSFFNGAIHSKVYKMYTGV